MKPHAFTIWAAAQRAKCLAETDASGTFYLTANREIIGCAFHSLDAGHIGIFGDQFLGTYLMTRRAA